MSVNVLDTADLDNTLQKVILPYVRDNLPTETIFMDKLKKNARVEFMNNKFYQTVRTGRHSGVGNLANDDNQTVSGKSTTSQANVSVKTLYGNFDISQLAIEVSRSKRGAVRNELEAQAMDLTTDFARSINRQFFSDGYGVLAQVRNTGGSVSGTEAAVELPDSNIDDGRISDVYGTVNGDIDPMKYFVAGQHVGVGTAGAIHGTVAAVTGTSVQFTGTLSIAAGDALYLVDKDGEGAGTSEIQGARLALSSSTGTSTYAGLARNTASWTPQFGSTSEALTLKRLEDKYIAAQEYSSRNDTFLIFVNKSLYAKYGDLLQAMRRSVNTLDLGGGWQGLSFQAGRGPVAVVLDYDVPDGEVIGINMDTWTICQTSDMNWLGGHGKANMLPIANKITYQATMVWFANLLCHKPAANFRLTQKTD